MTSGQPRSQAATNTTRLNNQPPWIWQIIESADRFVRLHFWGFTFFLVLLGAVSAVPHLTVWQIGLAMTVAALFHNFAYVFNDVVDLPVDRTQPSRRQDYLVRGVIRPWQALVFSLMQIPLAVALSIAGGVSRAGILVLLAGFVLMAIYDLWGKKCFCPPLTDLIQGLGWGCLVLYGAYAAGGPPNLLTWVAFSSGAGFIFLINGVHGGLRDLENDLQRGSRTSAIFFGSRPEGGVVSVHGSLKVFAVSIQVLLIATVAVPLAMGSFEYSPRAQTAMIAVQILLQAINLRFMARVFRTDQPSWGRDFRIHIFLLLLGPAILFWPYMSGPVAWVFPIAFLCPFLLVEVTGEVVTRVINRCRRALLRP